MTSNNSRYPAIKSPLRYAGGKTRAIKHLLPLFPPPETTVVSIFCGGSSVELARASQGQGRVICYDGFDALINFFQHAANDNESVARSAEAIREALIALDHDLKKQSYANLKQMAAAANDDESAAAFYAVNRTSFSGAMSGGLSPCLSRFQQSSLKKLRRFKDEVAGLPISWEIGDFKDTIPRHLNDFLFLDPPYALDCGNNLYGTNGEMHRGFDHSALANLLHQHDYWLLCYNDCEAVRQLYTDYTILNVGWAYAMTTKKSSEVIILSHRLASELAATKNEKFLKLSGLTYLAANDNSQQP